MFSLMKGKTERLSSPPSGDDLQHQEGWSSITVTSHDPLSIPNGISPILGTQWVGAFGVWVLDGFHCLEQGLPTFFIQFTPGNVNST